MLTLSAGQWKQIVAQVQAEWPNEACGLLAGLAGRVLAVYPGTNVLHSPVEYKMDPREQVRAFLDMEARGWELLAIYHSHPAGPGEPSPTDIARAYYPDSFYAIVSLTDRSHPELRAFRIVERQVMEVPVHIENEAP